VNFTTPFVAVFLNERMSKLTDESVMASTWEDFAEGWLALLSLRSEMESQRGQAVLDCICMDDKVLKGLGAVQQLSTAITLKEPPPFVLTLLKAGPGAHVKSNV
jgi:hypothetical protein